MPRLDPTDHVRELFEEGRSPPSRNKAFEDYRDPKYLAAVRLHRHLRTLADDLIALVSTDRSSAVVVINEPDGRLRFEYEHEEIRRQAYVRPNQLRILFLDAQISAALNALGVHEG